MTEVNRILKASYRLLREAGFTRLLECSLEKLRRREFRILGSFEELEARNLNRLEKGAPDGYPIPPIGLVKLVTSKIDLEWFLQSGEIAVANLESLLHRNGLKLAGF